LAMARSPPRSASACFVVTSGENLSCLCGRNAVAPVGEGPYRIWIAVFLFGN
jgi:hypothetical protein